MSDEERNERIRALAAAMESDGLDLDSGDAGPYRQLAADRFGASPEEAAGLAADALDYLRIKRSDMDPFSKGAGFGVGFS